MDCDVFNRLPMQYFIDIIIPYTLVGTVYLLSEKAINLRRNSRIEREVGQILSSK